LKPKDLIDHAERLVKLASKKPRQADLRRAVSASYYAVFHAIASVCADTLIGTSPAHRSSLPWRRVFRSLDHQHAKNQCSTKKNSLVPSNLEAVADAFVALQELRHTADYDPHAQFLLRDVQAHIALADQAITVLGNAPVSERRTFAAWVIFKPKAQ
jgi:hypothetical protein